MNPFEMVVLIVAIAAAASIARARYGVHHHRHGQEMPMHDPDTERLREEVKQLKERVAVLERLATDSSMSLEREFEKLRERD
jgi:Tfp pilus assembly protein PilO